MKVQVTRTFPFTSALTALPLSYRRLRNLSIALSTWSPRFTCCDLYQRYGIRCYKTGDSYERTVKMNESILSYKHRDTVTSRHDCRQNVGNVCITFSHILFYTMLVNRKIKLNWCSWRKPLCLGSGNHVPPKVDAPDHPTG